MSSSMQLNEALESKDIRQDEVEALHPKPTARPDEVSDVSSDKPKRRQRLQVTKDDIRAQGLARGRGKMLHEDDEIVDEKEQDKGETELNTVKVSSSGTQTNLPMMQRLTNAARSTAGQLYNVALNVVSFAAERAKPVLPNRLQSLDRDEIDTQVQSAATTARDMLIRAKDASVSKASELGNRVAESDLFRTLSSSAAVQRIAQTRLAQALINSNLFQRVKQLGLRESAKQSALFARDATLRAADKADEMADQMASQADRRADELHEMAKTESLGMNQKVQESTPIISAKLPSTPAIDTISRDRVMATRKEAGSKATMTA